MPPSIIILIRHGEKPKDKDDINLSAKGTQRASALAPYLLGTFGQPIAIYAMKQHKATTSVRPIQTIAPTAGMAGIQMTTQYGKDTYKDLVDEILTKPEYEGKMVFVCWEHQQIRDIAKKLGIPKKDIPKWKSDDYDHLWQLIYDGNKYEMEIIAQKLLYGDSKEITVPKPQ